jgi:hypothetical protein
MGVFGYRTSEYPFTVLVYTVQGLARAYAKYMPSILVVDTLLRGLALACFTFF